MFCFFLQFVQPHTHGGKGLPGDPKDIVAQCCKKTGKKCRRLRKVLTCASGKAVTCGEFNTLPKCGDQDVDMEQLKAACQEPRLPKCTPNRHFKLSFLCFSPVASSSCDFFSVFSSYSAADTYVTGFVILLEYCHASTQVLERATTLAQRMIKKNVRKPIFWRKCLMCVM